MPTVQFHFDFGSPNAYMSHKVIPGIEQRTGARFDYVPVLLGGVFKMTGNQAPSTAFGHIKNKPDYDRLEMQRFVKRHGLTAFRMNPHFPVNTLQIMRGAVAAEVAGVLAVYVDAVFADMWERGQKMDDPEVLRARLDAAGLPTAELVRLSQTDEVKGTLLKNTEASVARGTFGSPTFFVGDEIFFGKDRLRDVEEEIVAAAPAA
jgi:2-hydroxychromene-2-carboxylate isomerase